MKNSLLSIAFALAAVVCYGQPSPTTEEEYNYVTKGYQTQISQGLDMKKGYSFEDRGDVIAGDYKFSFKYLKRDSKNELAAILVVAKSSVSGNSYYLCIPHGSPELTKRYNDSFVNWDASILKAYSRTLSSYLMDATLH
ncbi:hypothetical protein WBG78_24885 [Chryseolinea sp. T2]|uniref:hypothetical protein n=1 Tax=Chryseolinea sp. T2 TaxID=3129255 RepID=UPI003077884B